MSYSESPYVVSGDKEILLNRWAERNGFSLPSKEYFTKSRSEFADFMKGIFPRYEFVSEEEIKSGIHLFIKETDDVILSLDEVYTTANLYLQVARTGDQQKVFHKGEKNLLRQLHEIRNQGIKKVILVDDVIFTGSMIERIQQVLLTINVNVSLVLAGIGIQTGVKRLKTQGIEVRCVRRYEKVIDQICERDFFPGTPLCGRLVRGSNNIGIPYLLPFGDPAQWASIPTNWHKPFSQFCIGQTVELFEAIEKASNKIVTCFDLERKVYTLPQNRTRFIDALQKSL